PGGSPLLQTIYPQPCHSRLVDLKPDAGPAGQRDESILDCQRYAHDILGEVEMGEADAPIHIVERTGKMHHRGGAETRFRHLGGDVDGKAKMSAQRARGEGRCEAPELDELERDASRTGGSMRLDIPERMNALIRPDLDRGAARQRREAFQVAILERLLQEEQSGLTRRLQVTPRRPIRE